MSNCGFRLGLMGLSLLVFAGRAFGQGPANSGGRPASTIPEAEVTNGRLTRWFELQMGTINARYRHVVNSAGKTTSNQAQHKESLKGRFKFDKEGRYSLNAGVFSGRNFIAAWNNTGWGTGDAQSNLALKQLFFSATPWKGLEIQYGGLYIARGESTEITSYDDDGYFMGERLGIKRPDKFFFDEISVAYGYLGDSSTPNIAKRFHRLTQSNYHQFLVAKRIGRRTAVSLDYTLEAGRETLRQAINVKVPETHIVDFVRFENYQRIDFKPDYGFALYGQKSLLKWITLGGGYAQIDPNYGSLNSDHFGSGNRLFLMGTLQLPAGFSIAPYATRATASQVPPVSQHTRFDLVVSYNFLKRLRRTGLF
jgi:hypothetical protein